MKRFILLTITLLCFAVTASAQLWSGIISSQRGIDWSGAGISGGIPSGSWTQCGATIAAYSGSPSTIINALNHTGSGYTSCTSNQYIQLGAGTFTLSGAIRSVGVSNTELRGMGANLTHLVFTAATTCQSGNGTCLVGFESSDGTYPTQPPADIYTWTAGYTQGTTSITLSSGVGVTANTTVLFLDQCDTGFIGTPCVGAAIDNGAMFACSAIYAATPTGCATSGPDTGFARPNRFQVEIVLVTGCSPSCGSALPTTVTITPALQHPNWVTGQSPQAWLLQPVSNDGFSGFSVEGAATTSTAGVSLLSCTGCWVTGVAVLDSYNIGIWLQQASHDQIESNYVYNAGQALTYSDPAGIKYNGSNNLIDNNITHAVRPGIIAEGPANGNVLAYNYTTNEYTGTDFMWGGIWEHSAGDDFTLVEGNVTDQIQEDQIHGSHLMETFYRNFVTGFESCANGQCGTYTSKDTSTSAIDDLSYNRYANYIANIIGTAGVTTTYQSNTQSEWIVNNTSWVVGNGNSGVSPAVPADSIVASSLFRWGNYDVVNGIQECTNVGTPEGNCPGDDRGTSAPTYAGLSSPSTTFPASFHWSSRPTWWSASIPFPAVGPDISSGNVGKCSGTLNTSGQYAGVAALLNAQCTGTSLTASQWGGHVNAIPAMNCYLNVMGGPPDGSGSALTFNANACYATGAAAPPAYTSGYVPRYIL